MSFTASDKVPGKHISWEPRRFLISQGSCLCCLIRELSRTALDCLGMGLGLAQVPDPDCISCSMSACPLLGISATWLPLLQNTYLLPILPMSLILPEGWAHWPGEAITSSMCPSVAHKSAIRHFMTFPCWTFLVHQPKMGGGVRIVPLDSASWD